MGACPVSGWWNGYLSCKKADTVVKLCQMASIWPCVYETQILSHYIFRLTPSNRMAKAKKDTMQPIHLHHSMGTMWHSILGPKIPDVILLPGEDTWQQSHETTYCLCVSKQGMGTLLLSMPQELAISLLFFRYLFKTYSTRIHLSIVQLFGVFQMYETLKIACKL